MRKIKLFLTALAVLASSVAFAQNLTVTGHVTDAATGEPVPFASLHEKGTMNGTNTDVDGNYTITVSPAGIIVFSSVGYDAQEVAVEGRARIDCELSVDSETLDNAVVVGYGSAKRVGTMVGSVTTVKSDAIKNAPSSSALDQLQGQVAGLAVMTTGGVAGQNNVSMTLHGSGSLPGGSGTAPLYIIDGIQASARAIQAMNPNDILSISILKDASATSIYGSRAANGVVVITTKAGGYDADATITFRSQAGISTLADKTLYENMMSGPELKEFWVKTGLMTPQQIYDTFTSKGFDADTKWYQYIQQFNNPQFQNDLTIEGGGQKVAYMIGASQFHQRGTSIGNYYDRYTVRTNVQGRPKDWLKVGGNISLSYDKRTENPYWNGTSVSSSLNTNGGGSYLINPLFPAIDPETGKEYAEMYPSGHINHRWAIENYNSFAYRYGLLSSFNVEIEPVRNLKIASRAGLDAYLSLGEGTVTPSWGPAGGSGQRARSEALEYAATITNTIEYSFALANDHQFTVLAGQEGVLNRYDGFEASSSGQTDDRLVNLQNGVQDKYSIGESFSESKFLSFFGRVDYALMNKYYFDASVRNDACSRFGPDNRNATFWAVGGMWKMRYESFMQNAYWLNDLNFKVSYGTQGNASLAGDYMHLALIGASGKYATGEALTFAQPGNTGLSWEQQALLTVGFNGRAFDRLDFNIEFYNRKTSSMLMSVPYNYTTGFGSLYSNVGGLRNTGFDITLGVDILRGRDYYFRVGTTFNYNDERVTELFDGRERYEMVDYGMAYVVGQPVMFYAPIWAGVDPEDGSPMWYLPGENPDVPTMDKDRVTKDFDSATLNQSTGKRYHAPINGGFNLAGAWRGISLQADFSYVLGKTLVNMDAAFYANPVENLDSTQHKEIMDYWTPDNRNAKYPDWTKGHTMQSDTHLYENANFLRLKNFQIAYDLPKRFLANQNVLSGLKVSFTGRNLLTVTKFSGIDPEVNSNATMGRVGNSKQFLFGLELTF